MAFENGAAPEDWRSAVIVPLYKDKRERTKCKNCKGLSLFIMVEKIFMVILMDIFHGVTVGLIDDKQGGADR